MPRLGVNIDHVATLRQLRRSLEPEPVFAALISEAAGADSIVAHLRQDRRHIQEKDLFYLRKAVRTKLNLEMSCADDIVAIACRIKPDQATLVPEKREELTTEGGLDVAANFRRIKEVAKELKNTGITLSLFIDPFKKQIDAASKLQVGMIELHTGTYANSTSRKEQDKRLTELIAAAKYARSSGLSVFAGHGLNYNNVSMVAQIKEISELNIGYSIICRAVFVGMDRAVREMKALLS
jgi:pyridoxine 5-phosphate synthase